MKRRGPGDFARIQRPLRCVLCAQDFDGCDDRAHRLAPVEIAGGDPFAIRDNGLGFNALGLKGAGPVHIPRLVNRLNPLVTL